jgi:hypothetical protein
MGASTSTPIPDEKSFIENINSVKEDTKNEMNNQKNEMNNQKNEMNNQKNESKKDEFYGDVTLLEFLCTIFSRLAYMNNTNFISHYKNIFKSDNILNKSDFIEKSDETIRISDMMNLIVEDSTFLNKFVKFLHLAEQVNIINGEQAKASKSSMFSSRSKEELNCENTILLPEEPRVNGEVVPNVLYISIASSNYSQCYVVADVRMPTHIFVVFRGTYSPKSAGSYTHPRSLKPTGIFPKSDIKVLTGIYKILAEIIHTILHAIEDIKQQLKLLSKSDKEIKLIVTGHSLGGALATLFTYMYIKTNTIAIDKKMKLSCVSIGAPRVFNPAGADDFCKMCTDDKLFEFKRVTTYNDPVPMLPKIGYQHPCSGTNYANQRELISTDCLVQSANSNSKRCVINGRLSMTPDYKLPLRCTQKKDRPRVMGRTESPLLAMAMGYHIMYLGILFAGALDLSSFLATPFGQSSVEINRYKLENKANLNTACRLCFYDGGIYKTVFFNLENFRKKNGRYAEDVYVTSANFLKIKEKATSINPDSIIPEDNSIVSTKPSDTLANNPKNGENVFPSYETEPFVIALPVTNEPIEPDLTEKEVEQNKLSSPPIVEKPSPEALAKESIENGQPPNPTSLEVTNNSSQESINHYVEPVLSQVVENPIIPVKNLDNPPMIGGRQTKKRKSRKNKSKNKSKHKKTKRK